MALALAEAGQSFQSLHFRAPLPTPFENTLTTIVKTCAGCHFTVDVVLHAFSPSTMEVSATTR
jgi:hypothetical protein